MCHIRYLLVSLDQCSWATVHGASMQHHINGKYPSILIFYICIRSFNSFFSHNWGLTQFGDIELVLRVFWGIMNLFWVYSGVLGVLWVLCLFCRALSFYMQR